jgi:hypothetical protein
MLAVASEYAAYPEVEAVTLGGSRCTGFGSEAADYDLYVYSQDELPLGFRTTVARRHGVDVEVDNRFWESGDEWVDRHGAHFDVMFRSCGWIEEQLSRSLDRHQASVGYSTCFWANVLYSRALFDRGVWYTRLQEKSRAAYPEPLRRAIVHKNYPILASTLSSYRTQIAWAIERDDVVSVSHRVAALLASYFDIVFAVNRLPHPGEKRQLEWVETRCPKGPGDIRQLVTAVLESSYTMLLGEIDQLLLPLDDVLATEGLP